MRELSNLCKSKFHQLLYDRLQLLMQEFGKSNFYLTCRTNFGNSAFKQPQQPPDMFQLSGILVTIGFDEELFIQAYVKEVETFF